VKAAFAGSIIDYFFHVRKCDIIILMFGFNVRQVARVVSIYESAEWETLDAFRCSRISFG